MKVINIKRVPEVFVIHALYKDFTAKEIYCHTQSMLDKRVSELCEDKNIHDFTIWQRVDFDLEENK